MDANTPNPGRRILRHQARIARASGVSLARKVAARHGVRRSAALRRPAGGVPVAGAAPMIAREEAPAGGSGVSDFAAQWMFGDTAAALSMPDTQPWAGGAGFEPPPPEQRRLNRLAREGAPAAARRAKIVEPGEALPPAPAQPAVARTQAPAAPDVPPEQARPAQADVPPAVVARAPAEGGQSGGTGSPGRSRVSRTPAASAGDAVSRTPAPSVEGVASSGSGTPAASTGNTVSRSPATGTEGSRPPAESAVGGAAAPAPPARPSIARVERPAQPRPVAAPAPAAPAPPDRPAGAAAPAASGPGILRRVADRLRGGAESPAPRPAQVARTPAPPQPRPLPPPARAARVARAPAPAPAAAPQPATPAAPVVAREPSDIGVSDFGMEWMFGDAPAALSHPDARPWAGGAGYTPPPPEQRRLNRLAREGAPSAARRAKIVEPGESLPAVVARTDAPAPAEVDESRAYRDSERLRHEGQEPAPRRLARRPAEAPEPEPRAAEPSEPASSMPAPEAAAPVRPSVARVTEPEAEPETAPDRPVLARVPRPAAPQPAPPQPAAAPRGPVRRAISRVRSAPAQPAPEPPAPSPRAALARAPMQVRTATPMAAQHSRTNAEALAAATGATISRTADGFAAVTFDSPQQPTLGRAVDQIEASPATTEREPSRPARSPGQQPPAAAVSESAPSTDKDEIYEYVVDRLKRDLFAEQEQAGLGPTLL